MEIFRINDSQVTLATDTPRDLGEREFLWLKATYDEVAADPQAWRAAIERATGMQIYDLHISDTVNQQHPSYFDSTQDYAMVIFRKLALGAPSTDNGESETTPRKIPAVLSKLATQPVIFFLTNQALITVHMQYSRTIDAMRTRLLDQKIATSGRLPMSPEELMLRLLNGMVDQYLELRQPLTTQLDHWQRALLDPRRPFNNWVSLLDARIELRKLDHLCEEQHDALQELRDYLIDTYQNHGAERAKDLLLVRINDVMEHVARVLNHARRLESSLESAVQIHFSAMAHRTSEIMRTLTVITALFMPLTLITGIFGMNFIDMPLVKDKLGFWITMGAMLIIMICSLLFFRHKRYLEHRAQYERR